MWGGKITEYEVRRDVPYSFARILNWSKWAAVSQQSLELVLHSRVWDAPPPESYRTPHVISGASVVTTKQAILRPKSRIMRVGKAVSARGLLRWLAFA